MARGFASSARAARAAKSARPTRRRRGIDFSEIRETSPVQLRAMRRVGRPPLGAEPRRLIAIRIDPHVLAAGVCLPARYAFSSNGCEAPEDLRRPHPPGIFTLGIGVLVACCLMRLSMTSWVALSILSAM